MRFAAPRTHPCSHYNAICIHSLQNTEEEPIDLATIQTAPAAHRRYPSSPAAATLHGKTYGFVLRLPPQNQPHATFMQPLITINAFCSTAWLTRIRTELRTQEQPLVAEHRGGNNSRMKRPQPQPPHTRGTIHCRPKPLYTEKRTVSRAGFLPKTSPMHSCSQYIAFCSITWLTRIFLRTWRQSMTTIMQPLNECIFM